jgi:hypothetical protein
LVKNQPICASVRPSPARHQQRHRHEPQHRADRRHLRQSRALKRACGGVGVSSSISAGP